MSYGRESFTKPKITVSKVVWLLIYVLTIFTMGLSLVTGNIISFLVVAIICVCIINFLVT